MAQSINFNKKVRLTCENDELERKVRHFLNTEGYHVVAELEPGVTPGPLARDHAHIHIQTAARNGFVTDSDLDFETESEFSKE